MKRIAINGFGRIGRLTFRRLLEDRSVEIVAINDLSSIETLAHLLKYDSMHGRFAGEVTHQENELRVNGRKIAIYGERDPHDLPWKSLGVDLVLECTGVFRSMDEANLHRDTGAHKVIISAPAKGGNVPTIVLGVNENIINDKIRVISNASCTTNCAAPMVKTIHQKLGIVSGALTTIHAYTADQRLQDARHSDLRRSRAAACSIIPTSTGAAVAIGLVIPELSGKLDGVAYRVPVATGSFTELSLITESKPKSVEEVNAWFKEAAEGPLKGILEYTEDPIVSADIVSNTHSCIFDAGMTMIVGDMIRIGGWYDNEMGYASRLADLAIML